MRNNFRLGLVAEMENGKTGNSRVIKSEDWKYLSNFFRFKGEVVLFDWKNMGSDFRVSEYMEGTEGFFGVSRKTSDIRNLCDVVYIGQLGKIHERKEEFLKFLDIMEEFPGQVVNPIKTIRSNLSKDYLLKLQSRGVRVVPTLEVEEGCSLAELRRLNFSNYERPIDDLVLKPKVFGEQGGGVLRVSEIRRDEDLQSYLKTHGKMIVQPLISDIYTRGENSFIFTGRNFSHGLNKTTGKFKINLCDSVKYSRIDPTKSEVELCQSVFDLWPTDFGYCRVDIIPSDKPLVAEVEMVNPAGYLAEVNAFEKYSLRLEDRLKDICDGKWN